MWRTLLALLALGSIAVADDCAWNENILSPLAVGGSTALLDTDCLRLSPASNVTMSSNGCQCTVSVNIIGAWTPCSQTFECDVLNFGFRMHGMAAGNGDNFMSGESFGSSDVDHWQDPPVLMIVDEMDVDCGAPFVYRMETWCECIDRVTRTQSLVDPGIWFLGIDPVVYNTITTTFTSVCESENVAAEFTAFCNQECLKGNEPVDLVVDTTF